ncbi:MAG: CGNR zinc finger domain-containing protein [Kineosporiaceae bacterium]|nr:CGNR zinc finger domain-containing protein [Kineosporiaceae bacterium]
MSSHLVDGVPVPDRLAGHPGLELCNTRAGWGSASPREYLTDDHALAVWAMDVELLPPVRLEARQLAASGDRFARRARQLREALYACVLGQGTTSAWDTVGRAAARGRAHAVLRPGADGEGAAWQVEACAAEDALTAVAEASLHAAALAAEDVLRSPLAVAVSSCPGQGCGWVFVDPRRRRRWCSMAVCGNRSKARRHARRRLG